MSQYRSRIDVSSMDVVCLQAKRLHDVLHQPFLKSKRKEG
jgi:hypothetical protein